jgi:hypothetical protein
MGRSDISHCLKKGTGMKWTVNSISLAVIMLLVIQLSACGTMLYPERRNQPPGGRIDVGVALLDGFWLLVGIIPGVIAFAVDFSTGAIYLPPPKQSRLDNSKKLRTVRFDPDTMTQEELAALIGREIGYDFRFSDKNLRLTRVRNGDEARAYFTTFE